MPYLLDLNEVRRWPILFFFRDILGDQETCAMNILFPVFLGLALFPHLARHPHHLDPVPRLWAQGEPEITIVTPLT